MRNKRNWLIIKGIFLLLFAVIGIVFPASNDYRKWIRIGMLLIFTYSFVHDVIQYKQKK